MELTAEAIISIVALIISLPPTVLGILACVRHRKLSGLHTGKLSSLEGDTYQVMVAY